MTQTVSVEFWPIEDLVPNPRNARVHSDEQVGQVARSIEQFGFTDPCYGTIAPLHRKRLKGEQ